jgi:hypothetical protein
VASPFPRDDSWRPAIGDTLSTVAFEKYDQPRLRGVEVSSATTQMIHSEQMLPLDGAIRLYQDDKNPRLLHLENKSGFNLTDVSIVFPRRKRRPSIRARFLLPTAFPNWPAKCNGRDGISCKAFGLAI